MHQPYLNDLTCVLLAPIQIWSDRSGQVSGLGAQGIYCGDDRVISELQLQVTSHDWEAVHGSASGALGNFVLLLRTEGDGADPVLSLTRQRRVEIGRLGEQITITNASTTAQVVELTLTAGPDATAMVLVKSGTGQQAPAELPDAELRWRWRDRHTLAAFSTDGTTTVENGRICCTWRLDVQPGQSRHCWWRLELTDDAAPFTRPDSRSIVYPDTRCADLDRLLAASAADLDALRLCDRLDARQEFVAAGSPWFLTLFGRDSLITALMLSATNPWLAIATLRTLAARQGRCVDIERAEQPGKILHEVRRESLDLQDGTLLPPHYFGTIDATLLWIILLGRLAEQGIAAEELAEFTEPLVGTLNWLKNYADADGDGFVEYFDESGHGLSNQGWKDSGDSIRFADGSLATGPIVLVEVQGYAYSAAKVAERLLPLLGRTPAERAAAAEWGDYASAMAERIRRHFWVSDTTGPYLAIALDRDKRPVDGVASNMGHLLGTGVLTAEEEGLVAARLLDPTMFSGYGIRTMSTTCLAYWPWRYHVGSVWTHDTAIIIAGLWRAGLCTAARTVAEGLLQAAKGFDNRLPELFGGQPAAQQNYPPSPYPASCRPQAWAAASAFVLAEVLAPDRGQPAQPD